MEEVSPEDDLVWLRSNAIRPDKSVCMVWRAAM